MKSAANNDNTTVVVTEEATPKISNKALLLNIVGEESSSSSLSQTQALPPPLNLMPRMARFSNPHEVPLQQQQQQVPVMMSYSNSSRRRRNETSHNNNNPRTMPQQPLIFFFGSSSPDDDSLASMVMSFVFVWSKPVWWYLWQQIIVSFKQQIQQQRTILPNTTTSSSSSSSTGSSQPNNHSTTQQRMMIKGIRNYGQTCYLNTVLQSLASLPAFGVYLERLVVWNQQRREYSSSIRDQQQQQQQSSLSALLLDILQHINNNGSSSTTNTNNNKNTTTTTAPNVRQLLELVAAQHAQFRAPTGGAIGKHPQDAEELLQTLLTSIEAELELLGPLLLFSMNAETEFSFTTTEKEDEETTVISSFHSSSIDFTSLEMILSTNSSNNNKMDPLLFSNTKDDSEKIPPEEKKQDEILDTVFIPRIDSEEDMRRMRRRMDNPVTESTATPIRRIATSSASPMSCWIGSALKCRKCHHRRPIHNTPIHSIPVVPLEVSQSLSCAVDKLSHSQPSIHVPPCRLEDCLAEFAAVEVVHDVECRSCTIQETKAELLDDIILFQQAIESQSAKTTNDLHPLQHELEQASAKLKAILSIDPDNDDVPLEEVLRSEELYLYNNDSIPIRRGAAYKRMLLTRLPAILTIHVQRRYYDPYTNRMTKTSQQVVFPELLDVAPYCAHGGISFSEGFLSQDSSSSSRKGPPIHYRLSSVIEHQGNAFHGHYVCYRRDPTSGQWYYTSDLTVKRVTWSEVSRCQAYLLFYEAFS